MQLDVQIIDDLPTIPDLYSWELQLRVHVKPKSRSENHINNVMRIDIITLTLYVSFKDFYSKEVTDQY